MRDLKIHHIDDVVALSMVRVEAMHQYVRQMGWIDAGRWMNREATLYYRDEAAAGATKENPSRDWFDHVVVADHNNYEDQPSRVRDFIEAMANNTGNSAVSILSALTKRSHTETIWESCLPVNPEARWVEEEEIVGDKVAEHGDYIVRHGDSSLSVLSEQEFRSLYTFTKDYRRTALNAERNQIEDLLKDMPESIDRLSLENRLEDVNQRIFDISENVPNTEE